jgi:hypothetical protein
MQILNLQNIPNQQQTITLDQVKYVLTFRTIGWRTYATININGAATNAVDGIQCVGNEALLPYKYLESPGGNFVFDTPNDEYPLYTQFGITHRLLYASVAELVAYRASLAAALAAGS